VTEIPEHLLKRSKAAKAKAEGAPSDSGDGAASTDATSTAVAKADAPAAPAKVAKAAVPDAPPPPKPDIPVVAAYKQRKKIPVWAMMTLSLLPVWGLMYVRSLTATEKVVAGPIGDGTEVYAGCASCHGTAGEGGVGRKFSDGEVMLTFPHIEDQLNLVYTGSKAYSDEGVGPYGDASRGHLFYNNAWMPAQGETAGGALTQAEILAVVCHVRYDLGGADRTTPEYGEEYEKWCSPESEIYLGLEDGTLTFSNLHEEIPDTLLVGTTPRPGTPAG
jgi:mono/diheme cytochrome c family protein